MKNEHGSHVSDNKLFVMTTKYGGPEIVSSHSTRINLENHAKRSSVKVDQKTAGIYVE